MAHLQKLDHISIGHVKQVLIKLVRRQLAGAEPDCTTHALSKLSALRVYLQRSSHKTSQPGVWVRGAMGHDTHDNDIMTMTVVMTMTVMMTMTVVMTMAKIVTVVTRICSC